MHAGILSYSEVNRHLLLVFGGHFVVQAAAGFRRTCQTSEGSSVSANKDSTELCTFAVYYSRSIFLSYMVLNKGIESDEPESNFAACSLFISSICLSQYLHALRVTAFLYQIY